MLSLDQIVHENLLAQPRRWSRGSDASAHLGAFRPEPEAVLHGYHHSDALYGGGLHASMYGGGAPISLAANAQLRQLRQKRLDAFERAMRQDFSPPSAAMPPPLLPEPSLPLPSPFLQQLQILGEDMAAGTAGEGQLTTARRLQLLASDAGLSEEDAIEARGTHRLPTAHGAEC